MHDDEDVFKQFYISLVRPPGMPRLATSDEGHFLLSPTL